MLNCILGMVDKTKRALTILQQRNGGPIADIPTPRPVGELLAATIRSTEEKVVEVRRRAEEAVHEVQRNRIKMANQMVKQNFQTLDNLVPLGEARGDVGTSPRGGDGRTKSARLRGVGKAQDGTIAAGGDQGRGTRQGTGALITLLVMNNMCSHTFTCVLCQHSAQD